MTTTITQLPIVPSIATSVAKSVNMEHVSMDGECEVATGHSRRQCWIALLVNRGLRGGFSATSAKRELLPSRENK